MRRTRLSLVNLGRTARPVVLAAAHEAFPGAEILEWGTAEAMNAVGAGPVPDLMVLVEPDEALQAGVTQAVNGGDFPRWAVVIMGAGSSDLAETVPPEEWNAHSLARIFHSAVVEHKLLCENLRLRGDLKTMARRISHDLRTPTACVYTSSDLLQELSLGKGAVLTGIAEGFRQSSDEISRIINRVSFILRASAEPSVPTAVDMGGVVASVLRQLEPEIRASGAVVMQVDSWPETTGVSPWLEVIWWNLLQNALRHGGPAARVRISWIPVAGGGHKFSVVDRGPGIASERRAKLFTPFDQLHAVRTSGLGLSIVERLVGLQGGCCEYEPQAESGAGFHFTLP